ncbi:hypothetical protein [Streptantibioticus silvisoli]|uniref:Uncharacterized protein n=1 Tax=Streptantibioticus silvisoli TaxID=2705255 RepID=A0ABT6VZT4_9ACTN|nr:hypothetical protein [Streptantibioticus silvisoli]MDI5963242.1 hypothetical protein [Streptantibioticus silvisoli]
MSTTEIENPSQLVTGEDWLPQGIHPYLEQIPAEQSHIPPLPTPLLRLKGKQKILRRPLLFPTVQGIPEAGVSLLLRGITASNPCRKDIFWKLIQVEVSVPGNLYSGSDEPSNATGKEFHLFPPPDFHIKHCQRTRGRRHGTNP